ncbi:MAG: AAA family ATPase, partial [Candidatus Lokiarchaeota archaeon]|nr:AAA family ATPase [Candidatus Lokiarchaeota archaeon]
MTINTQLKNLVQKKISNFIKKKRKHIKIGILGTHHSGKTTLGHSLVGALKSGGIVSGWVGEVARDCPLSINEETTFYSQIWILNSQINREIEKQNINEVIVTDRTVIDNFAYAQRVAKKSKINKRDIEVIESFVKYWASTYDFLFYLSRLKIGSDNDMIRAKNEQFQIEIDHNIKNLIKKWNLNVCKVKGKIKERIEIVYNNLIS